MIKKTPRNFKCNQCGSCCYSPRLYATDIGRIKKAGHTGFVYIDDLGNSYMKDDEVTGKCIFLMKKGKVYECSIYEFRPRICREYPSELIDGDCKPVKLKFDSFLEGLHE